jgi:hypothetical protein
MAAVVTGARLLASAWNDKEEQSKLPSRYLFNPERNERLQTLGPHQQSWLMYLHIMDGTLAWYNKITSVQVRMFNFLQRAGCSRF